MLEPVRSLGRSVASITDMYRLRLNGHTLGEINLPNGKGVPSSGTACVMQMVSIAIRGHRDPSGSEGDHPAPADPLLTEFGITLNDSLGEGPRQRLKEYVPRLARSGELDAGRVREALRAYGVMQYDSDALDVPGVASLCKESPTKAFQALDAALAA